MLFGFEFLELAICITVCTLAMEAAVLFVPAFIFLFPRVMEGFPTVVKYGKTRYPSFWYIIGSFVLVGRVYHPD